MSDLIGDLLNTAPCGFLSFIDDGTIRIVNKTLLDILDYSLEELIDQKIELILPVASRIFYQTHFFPLLKMQGKVTEVYFSLRSKSKVDIPILVNANRQERNQQSFNDCIFIPIHQRIRYEDELLKAKKIAEAAMKAQKEAEIALQQKNEELTKANLLLDKLVNIDGLTQIPNRRCFDERLKQEWNRLYREQESFSLLLFDVDYFKRYNDTYGHQLGDDCLIKIAQAAQKGVTRETDLVARYGGEEFVVILPYTNVQGALTVANRIHQEINLLKIPHQASDISDHVTISLGITTLIPVPYILPIELIHQADQALYQAKKQGRNQSVIFNKD